MPPHAHGVRSTLLQFLSKPARRGSFNLLLNSSNASPSGVNAADLPKPSRRLRMATNTHLRPNRLLPIFGAAPNSSTHLHAVTNHPALSDPPSTPTLDATTASQSPTTNALHGPNLMPAPISTNKPKCHDSDLRPRSLCPKTESISWEVNKLWHTPKKPAALRSHCSEPGASHCTKRGRFTSTNDRAMNLTSSRLVSVLSLSKQNFPLDSGR